MIDLQKTYEKRVVDGPFAVFLVPVVAIQIHSHSVSMEMMNNESASGEQASCQDVVVDPSSFASQTHSPLFVDC